MPHHPDFNSPTSSLSLQHARLFDTMNARLLFSITHITDAQSAKYAKSIYDAFVYDQKHRVDELDYAKRNFDSEGVKKAEERLLKEGYSVGYWTGKFEGSWVYDEKEEERKMEEWKVFRDGQLARKEEGKEDKRI